MRSAAVLACGLTLMQSAHAADVDIAYGRLKPYLSRFTTQVVSAKNNGGPIRYLLVECGFFQGNRLLAAHGVTTYDVVSGQTVYIEITAETGENTFADRTDCRVGRVVR
jgi:hypothetical protein